VKGALRPSNAKGYIRTSKARKREKQRVKQ